MTNTASTTRVLHTDDEVAAFRSGLERAGARLLFESATVSSWGKVLPDDQVVRWTLVDTPGGHVLTCEVHPS